MTKKTKTKPMTAREFVMNSGKCPVCRSENVDWGSIEVVDDSTYQEARCEDCATRFNTISRLVGYAVDDNVQTIKEDFGGISSAEEPVDVVFDELLHAHKIIRDLFGRLRDLRVAAMDVNDAPITLRKELERDTPNLRKKERAAALKKGRP